MIERKKGEMVTLDTRHDANLSVDRAKRYSQIIEVLTELNRLTAKEIAVIMQKKGYIPTAERNFTSPRLTELAQKGVVEPIGKTTCEYTGRVVTVWELTEVSNG